MSRRLGGRGSQGTVQCACCGAGPGSSNPGPGSGAINRGLEEDALDSLSGFPIENVGNDRGRRLGMTGGMSGMTGGNVGNDRRKRRE